MHQRRSRGLVCVDITGHILWQHNHPKAERSIDNGYALNVTGSEIGSTITVTFASARSDPGS